MHFTRSFVRGGALAFCVNLAIIPSVAAPQEAPTQAGAGVPSSPQVTGVKLWNEFYYGMTPESVVEILKGMNPKFRPEVKYRKGQAAEIKMKGAYISFDMFDESWSMKFDFTDENKLQSVKLNNYYTCIDEQLKQLSQISGVVKMKYPKDAAEYIIKHNDIYQIPKLRIFKNDSTSVSIFLTTISAAEIARNRVLWTGSFTRLDLERQFLKCPQFGGDEAILEITYANRVVQEAADQAATKSRSESEKLRQDSRENQMKKDIDRM